MEAVSAQISYHETSGEHDDPLPDVIWYRVDQSNSRWLYVDHPGSYRGGIPVGIQRVYQKDLSSAEARSMAAALLQAADEWDVLEAEVRTERARRSEMVRQCVEDLGGHAWPEVVQWSGDWVCTRCGSQPETVAYTYP
jgi:hypothetical protein